MNEAFNRLQTSSHKLAEALYQQSGTAEGDASGDQASAAGAGAAGAGTQGATGGEDNVIDAEYVDVDESK